MDVGFVLVLLALFFLVVFFDLRLKKLHNSFFEGIEAAVDKSRAEVLDNVINALHCCASDSVVIVFRHDGQQPWHDYSPEVFFQCLRVASGAGKSLVRSGDAAIELRLDQAESKVCVAVAHLDSDVFVEVLVMFLKNPVAFLEVGSELDRAGLCELSKSVDGSCLLVLLRHFLGRYVVLLLLVLRVRVEAELFLLLCGRLLRLAGGNDDWDKVVKDDFELIADCIGDQVEEGKGRFPHL